MKERAALLAAAFLFCAFPAAAKEWTVDYADSHLRFIGQEGDTKFTGAFRKFTVAVDFDPDRPEAGKISAVIDTGSATAGNADRDAYLPQADWFYVKKFPQARFVSDSIRKTATGYAATGNLTIKDNARPVTLNFTLTPEGDHMRVKGQADLVRTDFKVGEGQWQNENYVKFAVTVSIALAAKPVP